MKILYFGTVCDLESYDQKLKNCQTKPSVASNVFETALLDGFCRNGADVEIHSFPMIPVYPKSKLLWFGGNQEHMSCGYSCRWLRTINLPVLKQLSRKMDARKVLRRWLREHAEDGLIVTYSIPPFMAGMVLRHAKHYRVPAIAIVPDLLRDMYINEQPSMLKILKRIYLAPALRVQGNYDGYIYLTEAMHEVVAPLKPYLVVEGIADTRFVREPNLNEKSSPRAIMYAGMLHEKYGLIELLDAFEMLYSENVELWLFGSGTAVPEVCRRAEQNFRIRYFGTLSREEILEYERRATLLVNPRDCKEAFTQYSFPSKTIEYMISGTPLVTTRLKGIPDAYFQYIFPANSNRADELAVALRQALTKTDEELRAIGLRAQRFVLEEKNSRTQSARILRFLEEVCKQ